MDNDDNYTPAEGVPVTAKVDKPSKNKDKPNPLLACVSMCFTKYYPRRRKRAWTNAGKWMRIILGIATLAHFVAFGFCLLLVGPFSSGFNLLLFF